MREALGAVCKLLVLLLRLGMGVLSIWATVLLVQQGHVWVLVLWFFLLVPGFVLPFFTVLWLPYLVIAGAMVVLAILGSILDPE